MFACILRLLGVVGTLSNGDALTTDVQGTETIVKSIMVIASSVVIPM